MQFLLITALGFSITALVVFFSSPQPSPTELSMRYTPLIKQDIAQALDIQLEEFSLSLGINHYHKQSAQTITAITESLGPGVCVIDVNNDHYLDILTLGGSGHSRYYGKQSWWTRSQSLGLYLNKRGQNLKINNFDMSSFEDISASSGLPDSVWTIACAVADFNNDGWDDIFISAVGGSRLLKNNGNNSFTDVSNKANINQSAWSTGASFADINKDGLLDIYVSNYITYQKDTVTFERDIGFVSTTNPAMDSTLYDAQGNHLYINKGNFVFEEHATALGVDNKLGRSLHSRWTDLNNDTWPDLITLNDSGSPNQVFLNQAGTSFVQAKQNFSALEFTGARDLAIADFKNDGADDFFFSRTAGAANVFLDIKPNCSDSSTTKSCDAYAWHEKARNLHLSSAQQLNNNGMGIVAADLNNDSHIDLFIANGKTKQHNDTPYLSQGQSNSLYMNVSTDLLPGFVDSTKTSPLNQTSSEQRSSRGAIAADLNNDGQLEIIVANNNDRLQIYRTNASDSNHWINFSFVGRDKNEFIGTIIELTLQTSTPGSKPASRALRRIYNPASSLFSNGDPRVHIGLGQHESILSATFTWPDQSTRTIENLATKKFYGIEKDQEIIPATINISPIEENSDAIAALGLIESDKQLDQEELQLISEVLSGLSLNHFSAPLLKSSWQQLLEPSKGRVLASLNRASGSAVLLPLTQSLNSELSALEKEKNHFALSEKKSSLLAAIALAKNLELDESVHALVTLLAHSDTDIACAAAQTIENFHDQEEAALRKKGLAVKPLIRELLKEGVSKKGTEINSEKIICLLVALTTAEDNNAVLPIIKLIKHTPASPKYSNVKITALRALSYLRDTRAIATCQEIIDSPNEQAETKAAAIAALEIFKPRTTIELTNRFLNEASINQRLKALNWWLATGTSLFLSKDYLAEKVFDALKKGFESNPANSSRPSKETIDLATQEIFLESIYQLERNNLLESRVHAIKPLLTQLLNAKAPSPNSSKPDSSNVRVNTAFLILKLKAFTELYLFDELISNAENILLDSIKSSDAGINWLYNKDHTSNITYADRFIEQALTNYLDKPSGKSSLFYLLSSMKTTQRDAFILNALNTIQNSKDAINFIASAKKTQVQLYNYDTPSSPLFKPSDTASPNASPPLAHYLEWYFSANTDHLSTTQYIKLANTLEAVLQNQTLGKAARSRLIDAAAVSNKRFRHRILSGQSRNLDHLTLVEKLRLQKAHQPDHLSDSTLRCYIESPKEVRRVRLLALSMLAPRLHAEARQLSAKAVAEAAVKNTSSGWTTESRIQTEFSLAQTNEAIQHWLIDILNKPLSITN